ncbi:MAG TPA: hypothetical protein VN549_02645 [Negativicutes bacterium]|nr:hypothetical protein [Negativicutes bacterium]
MISSEELLAITNGSPEKSDRRLGTIDPFYTSGRPRIVFDGETAASQKRYPYLSSYTPVANDRVLLERVKGSYIVMGKVI